MRRKGTALSAIDRTEACAGIPEANRCTVLQGRVAVAASEVDSNVSEDSVDAGSMVAPVEVGMVETG